jgi:hypothetical protein
MKKMMTRWIVVFLLFGSPFFANAQYYHRLAASDFEGYPPRTTNFLAYTNCTVRYTYQVVQHNDQYDVDFDVRLELNKDQSYIRLAEVKDQDMLLHILRHEQGHYNIAYLLKSELARVFKKYRYSANYQNEITAIFNRVNDKYQHINDEYERQTEHMQNDGNQEKWNAWFSHAIDNTPVRALVER